MQGNVFCNERFAFMLQNVASRRPNVENRGRGLGEGSCTHVVFSMAGPCVPAAIRLRQADVCAPVAPTNL